jgi:hypothetical protein
MDAEPVPLQRLSTANARAFLLGTTPRSPPSFVPRLLAANEVNTGLFQAQQKVSIARKPIRTRRGKRRQTRIWARRLLPYAAFQFLSTLPAANGGLFFALRDLAQISSRPSIARCLLRWRDSHGQVREAFVALDRHVEVRQPTSHTKPARLALMVGCVGVRRPLWGTLRLTIG